MIARPRPRTFLFVSTALLVSLLSARAAHAEVAPAAPRCEARVVPDGTFPANLPAMLIDDALTSPGLTAAVEITNVTNGITLGKIPDPIVPKTTLLVPSTNDPLQIGTTYKIDYTVRCSNDSIAKSATTTFVAGAAVALPTQIGTARELETGAAVVTPTRELAAFMRTTRFEAFVDGESVGSLRYGTVYKDEIDVRLLSYGLSVGGTFVNAAPYR
jgi:hypothetical protein